MQGCLDGLDAFGPLFGGLLAQLQLQYLAAGKQAQGMAAGQHLLPIRVVIGSITVALAKALLQGGGADGIQRLLLL